MDSFVRCVREIARSVMWRHLFKRSKETRFVRCAHARVRALTCARTRPKCDNANRENLYSGPPSL
eukprot:5132822-Pleurochrysis_carterae.AAC.1